MSFINKPGKNSAWRHHNVRNLACDIILYEKIETTKALKLDIIKLVSKLITWAKKGDLHSRRLALRYIVEKKHQVMNKLFGDIKDRYLERKGGYLRSIHTGFIRGNGATKYSISLV